MYEAVGPQLMLCQLIALLEIAHPTLGWVRTGVAMPILQVQMLMAHTTQSYSRLNTIIYIYGFCVLNTVNDFVFYAVK